MTIYIHALSMSLQLNSFELATFEPIGLTMRVKSLMSASLFRPRVKEILRQALGTVKRGHILRKGLRNKTRQFLTSISAIRPLTPYSFLET